MLEINIGWHFLDHQTNKNRRAWPLSASVSSTWQNRKKKKGTGTKFSFPWRQLNGAYNTPHRTRKLAIPPCSTGGKSTLSPCVRHRTFSACIDDLQVNFWGLSVLWMSNPTTASGRGLLNPPQKKYPRSQPRIPSRRFTCCAPRRGPAR